MPARALAILSPGAGLGPDRSQQKPGLRSSRRQTIMSGRGPRGGRPSGRGAALEVEIRGSNVLRAISRCWGAFGWIRRNQGVPPDQGAGEAGGGQRQQGLKKGAKRREVAPPANRIATQGNKPMASSAAEHPSTSVVRDPCGPANKRRQNRGAWRRRCRPMPPLRPGKGRSKHPENAPRGLGPARRNHGPIGRKNAVAPRSPGTKPPGAQTQDTRAGGPEQRQARRPSSTSVDKGAIQTMARGIHTTGTLLDDPKILAAEPAKIAPCAARRPKGPYPARRPASGRCRPMRSLKAHAKAQPSEKPRGSRAPAPSAATPPGSSGRKEVPRARAGQRPVPAAQHTAAARWLTRRSLGHGEHRQTTFYPAAAAGVLRRHSPRNFGTRGMGPTTSPTGGQRGSSEQKEIQMRPSQRAHRSSSSVDNSERLGEVALQGGRASNSCVSVERTRAAARCQRPVRPRGPRSESLLPMSVLSSSKSRPDQPGFDRSSGIQIPPGLVWPFDRAAGARYPG